MGFSRGAAWAMQLCSRIEGFELVLLVGSYWLPRWSAYDKQLIAQWLPAKFSKQQVMFAYGDAESWMPDAQLQLVIDKFRMVIFPDCGRDESWMRAMQKFWLCLVR